ncbi:FAD-dependent monooxygenase [Nocardia bhagyanarayanae]|uniref:2-polyprenyl-6-methoxyphenol hydroxylase-like FAD-dependent oxidoreductase n=1 Tax=Nocardia bhagyanarayanae TaxID=1215925 RepID=A0A543FG65_9NOCA|nr:FAD-dependent monooxygenase [Nocardia bhagyanarayanae]TQM32857.1 2-polyprenyl-6-methoxyphenol hydroxylase-like FAD-dependent oxidoreductase [Nocardia bhagyanarayanae]
MTTDVVIVGSGPTGLMLACELSLAGVRPIVLERLPEPSVEPKANGLLGQVVRMMDRRGLFERLGGNPAPPQPNSAYFMFAAMDLDLTLLDDSPIYALPVPQHRILAVLAERAAELGAEIRWGHEVLGIEQDDDVAVDVAGPDGNYRLRARYLVGADGAHSVTRKLSGIGFPGVTYDRTTVRSAHVTLPAASLDPETGALQVPGYGAIRPFQPHRTEHGGFSYAPLPGHPPLVSTTEWDQAETHAPMSLDEMRASIHRVLGAEVPLDAPQGRGPHVLRRLTGGNTRVAERFAHGRVFLIGDAAHVYASGGGPGLNVGLQDAVGLGWRLAAEIDGHAPPELLAGYEIERKHAARRMVMNARAQSALIAPGQDVEGLRELFTELLRDRNTVQRLADLIAGADVEYDMGVPDAHPLVGRFAPDMDVRTPRGTFRLAELTRSARPLLLDLTDDASAATSLAAEPSARDRIEMITGTSESAVTAVMIRPDGYVVWASSSRKPAAPELAALHAAAQRWFGVPIPGSAGSHG